MLTVDTTTPDMSDRDVRLKSVCILLNPALGLLRKNPAPTPLSIRRIERHCRSALRADSESLLQFSGSPEDRTRHNSVISRVWATSPRLPDLVLFQFFAPPVYGLPQANCAPVSQVVREALESSPTGLQPIALPLELPNQVCFWVAVDA